MQITLDAREKQITKSYTAKFFLALTVFFPIAAAWYAAHSAQLPAWAVAAGGAVLSAFGLVLRYMPQAKIVAGVIDGDITLNDGVNQILNAVPGAQAVTTSTDAGQTAAITAPPVSATPVAVQPQVMVSAPLTPVAPVAPVVAAPAPVVDTFIPVTASPAVAPVVTVAPVAPETPAAAF